MILPEASANLLLRKPLLRNRLYRQLLGGGILAMTALAPLQASAETARPYEKSDDAVVTLSGRIAATRNGEFDLDYGSGSIVVEMDDWDRRDEARVLNKGDQVTVYGRIDDDFFEATTIEAGAVYVEGLNSYFYASSADEESAAFLPRVWVTPNPMPSSEMTVRGEVVRVDTTEKTFTVDLRNGELRVDTSQLGYDPTDDYGYQKIEVGDRVSVSGELDHKVFEGRVINARSLTTLVDDAAGGS